MIVYLNGLYVSQQDAHVSVDDRGFLFADGVYEVARIYDGHIFLFESHLKRLRRNLGEVRIQPDIAANVPAIATRLLAENNLHSGDATLYIQVTRGAAPRAHAFPAPDTRPTVFIAAKPFKNHAATDWEQGVAAVTVPDTRWSRCDIKSIALLPNVLANQQAKEAGAFEALFVRADAVIEGSHSNLFGVLDGELITYAASGYILNGITRLLVLDKARALGLRVREAPIPHARLHDIEELFLSGTTTEVMPVVRVDGQAIANGQPGPITCKLRDLYCGWVEEDRAAVAASHGAAPKRRAS